jgi:hypothetical protein
MMDVNIFVLGPAVINTHTLGSDYPMRWWLGLTPATLEFWVRFPNERPIPALVPRREQLYNIIGTTVINIHTPMGWWLGLAPDTLEF